MSNVYDGKNLASCFEVASAAWREIDALTQVIKQTLEIQLNNKFRYICMKRTRCNDENGWVGASVAECFGLIPPKKKTPKSYLGFQVSVLGDGMEIAGEPLVHFVHWRDIPLDLNDAYVGFPLDQDCEHQVESERLIVWPGDGQAEWLFSIRLTAINNEVDVKMIVDAMMALLQGSPADQALFSGISGLVRYFKDGGELKVIKG